MSFRKFDLGCAHYLSSHFTDARLNLAENLLRNLAKLGVGLSDHALVIGIDRAQVHLIGLLLRNKATTFANSIILCKLVDEVVLDVS